MKTSLQRFFLLETLQVAFYQTQAALSRNEIDRRMLIRASEIEQQHVENILGALFQLGAQAPLLGRLASAAGIAIGGLTSVSPALTFKVDMELEKIAINDYKRFIAQCEKPELKAMLWSNCLDESLHAEWFKARLAQDVEALIAP